MRYILRNMRSATYWQDYRQKNLEKIRAYERARHSRRIKVGGKAVSEVHSDIVEPIAKLVDLRRCQGLKGKCGSRDGERVIRNGYVFWLCKACQFTEEL